MRSLGACVSSFLFCAGLAAQSMNTGTILGNVTDASGAAVPGVTVRRVSESTALQREATTDAEGNYQILQIPAGTYRIEFEKTGFQRSVDNKGIALSAGQSLRINGDLKVGSLTETVQRSE